MPYITVDCRSCEGKGVYPNDRNCIFCNGTGKREEWQAGTPPGEYNNRYAGEKPETKIKPTLDRIRVTKIENAHCAHYDVVLDFDNDRHHGFTLHDSMTAKEVADVLYSAGEGVYRDKELR